MTDRLVAARRGAGARRARPTAHQAGWSWGWFAPARGLRPWAVDALLALVVAVVQIVGTIVYSHDEPSPWAFDAWAFGILLAGPVALLFRRRWPEAALAVGFVCAAGYAASGYPRGPAALPAFVLALLNAIMMGRRGFAWGLLAVGYPALVGLPSVIPDQVEATRGLADTAASLAWLPLAAAASEIARSRLERRAERAVAQREGVRRRASEERLLIARELHDVLAHNISLINVQSGVALHLLDERPEHARPALEAINEASEQALHELRSVLDVLHEGASGDRPSGESAPLAPPAPATGLRDVDGLVRRTRTAGLDVRLAVEGEARPVPAAVDLAAFRIVQEALTNVVRHAGSAARATVRLVYTPAELLVQVDDDGQAPGPTSGGASGVRSPGADVGRGIAGMRERVRALRGTFTVGPRPGRGFRVRAQFPLQDEAR